MRPENLEFIALWEASGWKAIDVARRLELSRGAISRYKSGDMTPSPQVLSLFKFILASEKPGALSVLPMQETALSAWEKKILDDLRWLHQSDRDNVIAVMRALISRLPRREPVRYEMKESKNKKCQKCSTDRN